MKLLEQIKEFSEVIDSVEVIEFVEEEHVSKIKLKLTLIDTTTLWCREVKVNENIVAYSYYWLRSDRSIIVGWDNAPHHKKVETFPHHKHVGSNIESSHQTNFVEVMQYIRDFLGD